MISASSRPIRVISEASSSQRPVSARPSLSRWRNKASLSCEYPAERVSTVACPSRSDSIFAVGMSLTPKATWQRALAISDRALG